MQVVYGGIPVKKHLRAIRDRTPDVLIATPGRCYDIMTQNVVRRCWVGVHGVRGGR